MIAHAIFLSLKNTLMIITLETVVRLHALQTPARIGFAVCPVDTWRSAPKPSVILTLDGAALLAEKACRRVRAHAGKWPGIPGRHTRFYCRPKLLLSSPDAH